MIRRKSKWFSRICAAILCAALAAGSFGINVMAADPETETTEEETEDSEDVLILSEEEMEALEAEEDPEDAETAGEVTAEAETEAESEEDPEEDDFAEDYGIATLSFSATKADQVYDYLIKQGFSTAAACGIMANIDQESSFSPTAKSSSGTYYGLCQWGGSRKTNLKNYAGSKYNTMEGQLDFMLYELKNSYSSVYKTLTTVSNSASGAYDAGYNFCYYYEIPDNKASRSVTRGNLAKNTYWERYKDGKTTGTLTSSSTTTTSTSAASSSSSSSSSSSKTYTKYKTTTGVNYRTGAGTSYKKKGTLSKGTQIQVEDGYSKSANGYTWKRFKKDSTNYYIASKYITKVSSSSSTSTSSSSSKTYTTYKTTTKVNYRTGAGTSYKKKGTLSKGTKIDVENGYSKKANGYTWYRFKKSGTNYYVASKYVSKVSSSSSTKTSSSSSSSKSYTTYKTTTRVNYRTGAGTSYKKKGTLSKGTKIEVEKGYSKKANGYTWYRFKKSGTNYYIASKYLKKA